MFSPAVYERAFVIWPSSTQGVIFLIVASLTGGDYSFAFYWLVSKVEFPHVYWPIFFLVSSCHYSCNWMWFFFPISLLFMYFFVYLFIYCGVSFFHRHRSYIPPLSLVYYMSLIVFIFYNIKKVLIFMLPNSPFFCIMIPNLKYLEALWIHLFTRIPKLKHSDGFDIAPPKSMMISFAGRVSEIWVQILLIFKSEIF